MPDTTAEYRHFNEIAWSVRKRPPCGAERFAPALSTSNTSEAAPEPSAALPRSRAHSTAFAHDRHFERIVATLQEAALDDAAWPRALALIGDACAMHSSHLAVVDAGEKGPEYVFGMWRGPGGALDALEREYAEHYFAADERVRRLLMMPAGSLVHIADLYTASEQSTSPVCTEFLPRWGLENQISVRLNALDGLHLFWTVTRTGAQGGWRAAQRGILARLLPHIRGAVLMRQALAKADARAAALTPLLDAPPARVLLVDRRGRLAHANAAARRLLAEGTLLRERGGMLHATPDAENRLRQLLAQSLPKPGRQPQPGELNLDPTGAVVPLRVAPVVISKMDFGARRVAAVLTA